MKKVILLMAGIAMFSAASAQLKYGAKAGLNLANIAGDMPNTKMKIGFHLGGFAKIPVAESFTVQPELLLSTQGTKTEFSYEGIESDSKLNLTYINIPVMAQYNHESGFFAETGPQFGFLVSAKSKTDEGKVDAKDGLKTFDMGWGIGAGYLTKSNFGFNARFNFGLSNIAKTEEGDGDGKAKNSVIQVGVFYVLGEK